MLVLTFYLYCQSINKKYPFQQMRWGTLTLFFSKSSSEVVVLDVLLEEGSLVAVLSVISNAKGAASSDLSGFTKVLVFAITLLVFALAGPFSEIGSGADGNEWDFVLLSKSSDKFLVFGIITVFSQDAQVSITSIEGFTYLVESFNNAYKLQIMLVCLTAYSLSKQF
jgi:hypothetical protein